MIAALYVEPSGAYYGLPGVDPWDEARDARKYAGPWPVVAHPPCERWGRFWHGSPRKPHQFKLGDDGGWHVADWAIGWTCYVEQGFYGHAARKPTWLYAARIQIYNLPALRWGQGEQRLDPKMVERHGYEYARRKGIVSMIGGKDKKAKRNATPPEFRDLLLSIARNAGNRHAA